jgi:ATP-binding protein involved in chromosome partitioning
MVKYAIPVSGGVMCPHFGHCEQFALIDVDEAKKEILKKAFVPSPKHQPGLLPRWLTEQGVSLVIAGGMGQQAQDLFQQNHIGVIIGAVAKDPETAVQEHLNGMLSTGANICDH